MPVWVWNGDGWSRGCLNARFSSAYRFENRNLPLLISPIKIFFSSYCSCLCCVCVWLCLWARPVFSNCLFLGPINFNFHQLKIVQRVPSSHFDGCQVFKIVERARRRHTSKNAKQITYIIKTEKEKENTWLWVMSAGNCSMTHH